MLAMVLGLQVFKLKSNKVVGKKFNNIQDSATGVSPVCVTRDFFSLFHVNTKSKQLFIQIFSRKTLKAKPSL